MAAPSFIAKGTISTGTGSSVTPSYPGSIVAGDLLLMLVISDQLGGSIGSINSVSGWTLYDSGNYKNSTPSNRGPGAVFYKVATGSESGTVSVSRTGDTGSTYQFAAQIYQYRGSNGGPLIESEAMNNTGDGNATVTWNAVTVSGNERTLVALVAQLVSSSPGTPSGYTASATDTVSAGSVDVCLVCNTKANVSSDGSTTGGSGSSNGWITFHLSIFNPGNSRSFIVN